MTALQEWILLEFLILLIALGLNERPRRILKSLFKLPRKIYFTLRYK
jgi:hypothetical protein